LEKLFLKKSCSRSSTTHQQQATSSKEKCLETYDWASALSICETIAEALKVLNQCFVLLYFNKTSEFVQNALL